MPNKQETIRVEAPMPTGKTRSFVFPAIGFVLGAVLASLLLSTLQDRRRASEEAAPMAGSCKDVPMRKYVGPGDRDGKTCQWKGSTYWCVYDPNKSMWSCDFVDPSPVEKK